MRVTTGDSYIVLYRRSRSTHRKGDLTPEVICATLKIFGSRYATVGHPSSC